jgi:hypothetical protein
MPSSLEFCPLRALILRCAAQSNKQLLPRGLQAGADLGVAIASFLAERVNLFMGGEEQAKGGESARYQVNNVVAMEIIPRASTLPHSPGAPQDLNS